MVLIGKDERKRTLGRPRSRSDVNIKINIQKMEWQNLGLFHVSLFSWSFVYLVGWLVIQSTIQPVSYLLSYFISY